MNGIRVFEAAARCGSFKRAAVELHITPTAVSHQIRNLEQQLGVALFARETRAVRLTDAGRQLADAARRALQLLSDAVEGVSTQHKLLTVNTTTSFAALWLVPRLQSFRARHPDLQVVIQTDERVVDLQRERGVDLAIRYGRRPEQAGAELLLNETFGLYGTPRSIESLEKGEAVAVFETRWKNPQLPPISAQKWLQRFAPAGHRAALHRYDQELHVIQAAMAGQGLAFVSSLLTESAVRHRWLQPCRGHCQLPGFGYYLVGGGSGDLPVKAALFRGWLLDEVAGEPGPAP